MPKKPGKLLGSRLNINMHSCMCCDSKSKKLLCININDDGT
jgi:hypothetical protein